MGCYDTENPGAEDRAGVVILKLADRLHPNPNQERSVTFHPSIDHAHENSPFQTRDTCLCCGQPASGPLIGYDLELENGTFSRALMHRDCAFAMAQRIIMDAWPNRRAGGLMQNDR